LGENLVYGGALGYKELIPNVWGMAAGDGNADNQVDMLDKTMIWEYQVGEEGYLNGDYNLDGQVDNQDKNKLFLINIGKISQVPE
jgi:hypothetical protein